MHAADEGAACTASLAAWAAWATALLVLFAWCRFFKRHNKVVLDVAAVDRERSRLEQENADLRQLLKNFLDGIRCGALHAAGSCRSEI